MDLWKRVCESGRWVILPSKGGLEYWWCCCYGFCLHCFIHATRRGGKQETDINVVQGVLNLLHAAVH